MDTAWLDNHIRVVADFPKPGVSFKDITPLLAEPDAFRFCVDSLADRFSSLGVDKVIGVEARGFIIAAPVAYRLGASFIPVRKAGKLPWAVAREEYSLEYGSDRLEIHRDAIHPGERVIVIDDVLATGGTAEAVCKLIEGLTGVVAGIGVVIELEAAGGRAKLGARHVESLLRYP